MSFVIVALFVVVSLVAAIITFYNLLKYITKLIVRYNKTKQEYIIKINPSSLVSFNFSKNIPDSELDDYLSEDSELDEIIIIKPEKTIVAKKYLKVRFQRNNVNPEISMATFINVLKNNTVEENYKLLKSLKKKCKYTKDPSDKEHQKIACLKKYFNSIQHIITTKRRNQREKKPINTRFEDIKEYDSDNESEYSFMPEKPIYYPTLKLSPEEIIEADAIKYINTHTPLNMSYTLTTKQQIVALLDRLLKLDVWIDNSGWHYVPTHADKVTCSVLSTRFAIPSLYKPNKVMDINGLFSVAVETTTTYTIEEIIKMIKH